MTNGFKLIVFILFCLTDSLKEISLVSLLVLSAELEEVVLHEDLAVLEIAIPVFFAV